MYRINWVETPNTHMSLHPYLSLLCNTECVINLLPFYACTSHSCLSCLHYFHRVPWRIVLPAHQRYYHVAIYGIRNILKCIPWRIVLPAWYIWNIFETNDGKLRSVFMKGLHSSEAWKPERIRIRMMLTTLRSTTEKQNRCKIESTNVRE